MAHTERDIISYTHIHTYGTRYRDYSIPHTQTFTHMPYTEESKFLSHTFIHMAHTEKGIFYTLPHTWCTLQGVYYDMWMRQLEANENVEGAKMEEVQ